MTDMIIDMRREGNIIHYTTLSGRLGVLVITRDEGERLENLDTTPTGGYVPILVTVDVGWDPLKNSWTHIKGV